MRGKFSKRGKLALVFIVALIAVGVAGIIVAQKNNWIKISADTKQSFTTVVEVKKSGVPVSGASVLYDQKPSNATTDSSGKAIISSESGKHTFSANMPPDCSGDKEETISRNSQKVTINLTCGVISPIPSPTTTRTATATPTPTASKTTTPQPATGKGNIEIYIYDAKTNKLLSAVNLTASSAYKTASGKTGSSGYYKFSDLPTRVEGTKYQIRAEKSGYTTQSTEVVLKNSDNLRAADIKLLPSGYTPSPTPSPTSTATVDVNTQKITVKLDIKDATSKEYIKGIGVDVKERKRSGANFIYSSILQSVARTEDKTLTITGLQYPSSNGYKVELSEQTYIYNLYQLDSANFEILPSQIPANKVFRKEILLNRKNNLYGNISLAGMAKIKDSTAPLDNVGLKFILSSDYGTKTVSTESGGQKLTYIYGRDGKTGVSLPQGLEDINYQGQERSIHYSFLDKNLDIEISPPSGFYYDTNKNSTYDEGIDNKLRVEKARDLIFENQDSNSFEKIGTILVANIDLLPIESVFDVSLRVTDKDTGFVIPDSNVKIFKKEKTGSDFTYTKIGENKTSNSTDSVQIYDLPATSNDRYGYRIEVTLPEWLNDAYPETKKTVDISLTQARKTRSFESEVIFDAKDDLKYTVIASGLIENEKHEYVGNTKVSYDIEGLGTMSTYSSNREVAKLLVNLYNGQQKQLNTADGVFATKNFAMQIAGSGKMSLVGKRLNITLEPPDGLFYDTNQDDIYEPSIDNRYFTKIFGAKDFSFNQKDRIFAIANQPVSANEPLIKQSFVLENIPDSPKFSVTDTAASTGIAGAQFVFEDTGCGFRTTGTANKEGVFVPSPANVNGLGAYLAKIEKGICVYRLFVRISANSFTGLQDYVNKEKLIEILQTGGEQEYRLKPSPNSTTGGVINGQVYSAPDTNIYVEGVKITLLKDNLPVTFATTNEKGEFEFKNLSAGKYQIMAFSIDYCSTKYSIVPITLKKNEQVVTNLGIAKCSSNISTPVYIHVIDKNSSQPVGKARVVVDKTVLMDKQEDYTDNQGRVQHSFMDSEKYFVSVFSPGPSSKLLEKRQVDGIILKNGATGAEDMSKELVFYVDYPSGEYYSGQLTILTKNINGQPLSNADLMITTDVNTFIYFKAKTNSAGEAHFSKDFLAEQYETNSYNLTDFPDNVLGSAKAIKGQILTVYASKDDYSQISASIIIGENDNQPVELILEKGGNIYSVPNPPNGTIRAIALDALSETKPVREFTLLSSDKENGTYNEIESKESGLFLVTDFKKFYKVRAITFDEGETLESKIVQTQENKETVVIIQSCKEKAPKLVKKIDNDLFFIFMDEESLQYYEKYKYSIFEGIAQQITKLRVQSSAIKPLYIAFGDLGEVNAYAFSQTGGTIPICVGSNKIVSGYKIAISTTLMRTLINENRSDMIVSILTHEYGHHIYASNPVISKQFEDLFNNLYSRVDQDGKCVWDRMQDGNLAYSWLGGHPYDNAREMFASFYSAYFSYHERLYGVIQYHATEDSSCQNVLKYIWQFFAENVGKYYSNDDQYFIPVGGKIGGASYSYGYIANGYWLKDKFDKMSVKAKASVQYQRFIKPILDSVTNVTPATAVANFNAWLDGELSKLGLLKDVGVIYGKVIDSEGIGISDAVIMIGERTGVTDKRGRFTINKVPIGTQKVYSVTTKEKAYRVVSPSIMTVVKDRQNNITVNVK